jgi:hypothetical protein
MAVGETRLMMMVVTITKKKVVMQKITNKQADVSTESPAD